MVRSIRPAVRSARVRCAGQSCGTGPASLPATAAREPAMSATADLSAARAADGGEAPDAEAPVPDLRTAEARIGRLLRHACVPRVKAGHGGPACGADRGGVVGGDAGQSTPAGPAGDAGVAEGPRRRSPPPEEPAPGLGRRSCGCASRSLKPLWYGWPRSSLLRGRRARWRRRLPARAGPAAMSGRIRKRPSAGGASVWASTWRMRSSCTAWTAPPLCPTIS